MRWNEATTSATPSSLPLENLMPLRILKSIGLAAVLRLRDRFGDIRYDGVAVGAAHLLKATRPSYIAEKSCQYCCV